MTTNKTPRGFRISADDTLACPHRTAKPLAVGDWIYIHLGGATCPTCVAVSSICGTISEESEKAVRLRLQDDRGNTRVAVWFPRKALLPRKGMADQYTLARWFRPDGYAARMIERYTSVGGVSGVRGPR